MAKLSDISAASKDNDLRDRLISAAEEKNIPNPVGWVDQNARKLVLSPVSDEIPDTVASVYSFAVNTYPLPPGMNPSAVTDDYLRYAVEKVRYRELNPEPEQPPE